MNLGVSPIKTFMASSRNVENDVKLVFVVEFIVAVAVNCYDVGWW